MFCSRPPTASRSFALLECEWAQLPPASGATWRPLLSFNNRRPVLLETASMSRRILELVAGGLPDAILVLDQSFDHSGLALGPPCLVSLCHRGLVSQHEVALVTGQHPRQEVLPRQQPLPLAIVALVTIVDGDGGANTGVWRPVQVSCSR